MTVAAQPHGPQKTAAPPPKPASRMTLGAVVKGKQPHPLKVTIHGPGGIGKSTFGASAPAPIFIGAEDGTGNLDVARFPKPETFAEVFEAVRTLAEDQHDYQTLVIDSLDWLEPMIWRDICRRADATSIEEVGGGYGKGYTAAVDEWRRLLAAIERLQTTKRMHVVLIGHTQVKNFKNPEGPDYDRYILKLNEKAAGLIKEWSDALLFAKYERVAHTDKKTKRVRGVDTGARLIFTEERAAYDAKNRYSLPESLPLSWNDFFASVQAARVAEPSALREEILRKAAELGPEIEAVVKETVVKAGDNAQQLALINNRVNARLAEKAASETAADDAAEKVN
jgi:hypothetical protein